MNAAVALSCFQQCGNDVKVFLHDPDRGRSCLRAHQHDALAKIEQVKALPNSGFVVVSMATGTGKPTVAVLAPYFLRSKRVLVIAPNPQLCGQLYGAFYGQESSQPQPVLLARGIYRDVGNWRPEVRVVGETREMRGGNNLVQHAVIFTHTHQWVKNTRPEEAFREFNAGYFDLVIIDEAHQMPAFTISNVYKHFQGQGVFVVMLTATPYRSDEQQLVKDVPATEFKSRMFDFDVNAAISASVIRKIAPPVFVTEDAEDGTLDRVCCVAAETSCGDRLKEARKSVVVAEAELVMCKTLLCDAESDATIATADLAQSATKRKTRASNKLSNATKKLEKVQDRLEKLVAEASDQNFVASLAATIADHCRVVLGAMAEIGKHDAENPTVAHLAIIVTSGTNTVCHAVAKAVACLRGEPEYLNRGVLECEALTSDCGSKTAQESLIGRFRRGEVRVLCVTKMLLEGFDEPAVSVVGLAGNVGSNVKYAQAVGRAVRLSGPDDPVCATVVALGKYRGRITAMHSEFMKGMFAVSDVEMQETDPGDTSEHSGDQEPTAAGDEGDDDSDKRSASTATYKRYRAD